MAKSAERFASLLTQGIYEIRRRESKKIAVVQDELGYALGKNGGASIEYWRKGYIPAKLRDVATLAEEIVARGGLDRSWLEQFLRSADYPAPTYLCDELFPPNPAENLLADFQPAPDEKLVSLPVHTVPDPAPLPPGSLMPRSKNPLFVGRESDLRALAVALKSNGAMTISQVETAAATGLGGIGKTQLANEFVHRYGQFFDGGVYWLSFDNPEAIPAEIATCGDVGAMELRPDFGKRSLTEQVKLVQAAWQKPVPRLLVFDNCEDPALLTQWRPSSGGCRVLVTSRRGGWEAALGVQMLALGVLSRRESIDLLQKHCPQEDEAVLNKIAEELGDLPLALHLAGHYLSHYRRIVSPEDYLQELQSPLLLHHPSMQGAEFSPTGHIQHVAKTFALSYDRLDQTNEVDALAITLLVHAAHFAPGEPIWYKLLVQTLGLPPEDPNATQKAEEALQRLIIVGLIETEQDYVLRMHRLVAKFVRDIAAERLEQTQAIVEEVVFQETAHINQAGYPMPLLAWQLHLRSVVDIAQAREDEQGACLSSELGQHLWQIGDYEGALPYARKALEIREKLLGVDHLDTAESLNQLGHIYHSMGNSDEALPRFEQALSIRENQLGRIHADIAESLNYVGRSLLARGETQEAQAYFKKALDINRNVLGSEHPLTAEYENNVAISFMSLDKAELALPYLQRALNINERALGHDHPDTAMNLNNIALSLKVLGRLQEAEPYFRRALEIRRNVLGDEHPDTAQSLNNLGSLFLAQKNYRQAHQYLEQALRIYENAFPEAHPNPAFCLNNLGLVLRALNEQDRARLYLEQALAVRQQVLDDTHPLLALSHQNLGLLLADQGEIVEARKHLDQALLIYKASPDIHTADIEVIQDVLIKLA